jgi:hypothetical protein
MALKFGAYLLVAVAVLWGCDHVLSPYYGYFSKSVFQLAAVLFCPWAVWHTLRGIIR